MWINQVNGQEYSTEEEARDSLMEIVSLDDLSSVIGFDISLENIIQELARLDSPLYYQLLEKALEECFGTYISEIDDEENA